MAHYTVNPLNRESFSIISAMIEEYASLFSSKYFNLCCDETFDLGRGKSKEIAEKIGIGKLYGDFVKKLCNVVISLNKIPMIWGDIVLKYPEIITELPEGTIFLNWDYSPSCTEENVKFFHEKGVSQYVCPGVWGWSRFVNDINKATKNIRCQIEYGLKYKVDGVLITDWGDCGHVNFFTTSLHGLALGAFLSWNSKKSIDDHQFDRLLSEHEWDKKASLLYQNLRKLGSICCYHFENMYAWINNQECHWNVEKEVSKYGADLLYSKYKQITDILNCLQDIYQNVSDTHKKKDFEEILWGSKAVQWTVELLMIKLIVEYGKNIAPITPISQFINKTKELRDNFISLWLRKNKKSELENVISVFDKVIEKLI